MSDIHIVPPCSESVEILQEDRSFLLVNKPSGLLSVPGKHPLNKDSLISRLQHNYPQARIVHRLDLDTSGIMVVALGASAHRHLSLQFQNRETDKTYEAIVFGKLKHRQGRIDLPLICDWPNRPKQKVDFEIGKPSLTHYQVINEEGEHTRIQFTPITGRSHQLRVHAAEIDHPILGCDFYAHKQALAASTRLLLHAHTLSFKHPQTLKRIEATCCVPF